LNCDQNIVTSHLRRPVLSSANVGNITLLPTYTSCDECYAWTASGPENVPRPNRSDVGPDQSSTSVWIITNTSRRISSGLPWQAAEFKEMPYGIYRIFPRKTVVPTYHLSGKWTIVSHVWIMFIRTVDRAVSDMWESFERTMDYVQCPTRV